jgi:transcriptional regulator with XRE-family HTH domain
MTTARAHFGAELRRWRAHRRFSQLALSAAADVSQRHLSYLETGKARPSREMVIHLARVLELPLRVTNQLLVAAGFAPEYAETSLDAPAMAQIRTVLDFILSAHEPYPAIIVDRRWNVAAANPAAGRLLNRLTDIASTVASAPPNIARLTFHPDGLRTVTVNWAATASAALARLDREVASRPGDEDLEALHGEVLAYAGVAELRQPNPIARADDLLLPVHYRIEGFEARLFTTLATVGAPYDVTLEELRIETFLPADAESDAALRLLAQDSEIRRGNTPARHYES